MFKKSYFLFSFCIFIVSVFTLQVFYINETKRLTPNTIATKNIFVKVTSLPDLALCTETTYVRHRSISDLFSIYRDDGTLREYFPSTFTYAHSKVINEK